MTVLEFIQGMQQLPVEHVGVTAGPSSVTEANDMSISSTPFKATLTVEELAGFNPNIGVIWPGALVQGSSLKSGALAGVSAKRTPLTILLSTLSASIDGGQTPLQSAEIQKPAASTVEQARAGLVNQGQIFPAKLGQTYKQFYSLDQAMMTIGASASYLSANIRAQLDSEKYSSQSNIMVSFAQEFYTCAVELPDSPDAYIDSTVSVDTLSNYVNDTDNPLTYVQSVTYGRIGLLLATSSVEYSVLKTAIEAFVSFTGGNAAANYGDTEKHILESSEVKFLLLGGSPTPGVGVASTTQEALKALDSWIKQPIDAQTIRLGVPISYRVNYMRDNQVARISFTTDYTTVASSPIPQLVDWGIAFFTADDDKDNDTALRVEVRSNGQLIAGHSENGQKFDNGSTISRGLTQYQKLYARDSGSVSIHIRIDPNGNDTWDFSYTLNARNTGGGNFSKSGHMRLDQDGRDGNG